MAASQKWREEFIGQAVRAGLTTDTARYLMRQAATLQRLAEAQCNGDWPYNGDRDRPSMTFRLCDPCGKVGCRECAGTGIGCEACPRTGCQTCQGTGRLQTNGRERQHWDRFYRTCDRCNVLIARSQVTGAGVCADCRAEDRAQAALPEGWRLKTQGDPRGCVLQIAPPSVTTDGYTDTQGWIGVPS